MSSVLDCGFREGGWCEYFGDYCDDHPECNGIELDGTEYIKKIK